MKLQLKIIFLVLKFVFCFLTEANGKDDENEKENERRIQHERLSEKVLRKPTVSEITSAISDSEVYQKIQVERLQQFMYIAPYEVAFIETLNAYKTLSSRPIEFSTNDITTLTSKCDDGESLNNRILTQIKFYRKLQEIHCTNCVFLKAALAQGEDDLKDIVHYVYLMIDMSYRGGFIVSDWLWKLHVQLLELKKNLLDTSKLPNDCLPEMKESLRKILTECRGNNYIINDDPLPSDMSLKMDDQKYRIFFFDNYKLRLGIDVGNLLLNHLWRLLREFTEKITGLLFRWTCIYPIIEEEINNLSKQYTSGEWPKQPFKHIKLHKVLLDIIKAKWYCYIWIHLFVYQKIGSRAQYYYDMLIHVINAQLNFMYTDDQTFNDVLILLSKIYTPEDDKINTTIELLKNEVNRILRSVTGPNYEYKEATISYELINKKTKRFKDPKFLHDHVNSLKHFVLNINSDMDKTSLSILLFYIRGNQFTDFVFPNE
ncbi:uncharacterized protein LOC126842111 isoform X7 [Adelges cooleyi]|uniref:uncharacterized protein LOC126842111 isoform X7 n=1 Tax=Adelges cooleyi TaxID=133065 RepID=UPI0021800C73|nr:uncharacterized protein LOC126842111 isoform X7 [Adelges cooleyi]